MEHRSKQVVPSILFWDVVFALYKSLFYANFLQVGTFMAFSIVSSVLAAVIIICYSVILAIEIPATNPCRRIYYSYHPYSSEYCPSSRTKNIAISVMVLLFGVAEFPIAIWSAVLQCRACACCYSDSTVSVQINHKWCNCTFKTVTNK